MKFSKDFLLGSATAAHQVEGNNVNSDYWLMENMPHTSFADKSGDACDHYHRYPEDIRLMAKSGLNAYRFSIEWARIEPEEGKIDEGEIEHYRDMIRVCRENGIEPIVTLHHFSSPAWLIRKGGWEAESTVEDFRRYAKTVIGRLGGELKYVCTINEANMGVQIAAVMKKYRMAAEQEAKQQKADGQVQVGLDMQKMMENMKFAAMENMEAFGTPQPQIFVSARTGAGEEIVMRAHEAARDVIREINPGIKVGLTLSLHDLQCVPGGEKEMENAWEEEFGHVLPHILKDDFIGVQNYTRAMYGPEGQMPVPKGANLTQMDYEYYPEALEHVIRKVAAEFPGDIIVTENGAAVSDDRDRVEFIRRALRGVERCLEDGIRVKGYLYWSLLDNFEWQKGFGMTFGLVGVNRETQERTPKESLKYLGSFLG